MGSFCSCKLLQFPTRSNFIWQQFWNMFPRLVVFVKKGGISFSERSFLVRFINAGGARHNFLGGCRGGAYLTISRLSIYKVYIITSRLLTTDNKSIKTIRYIFFSICHLSVNFLIILTHTSGIFFIRKEWMTSNSHMLFCVCVCGFTDCWLKKKNNVVVVVFLGLVSLFLLALGNSCKNIGRRVEFIYFFSFLSRIKREKKMGVILFEFWWYPVFFFLSKCQRWNIQNLIWFDLQIHWLMTEFQRTFFPRVPALLLYTQLFKYAKRDGIVCDLLCIIPLTIFYYVEGSLYFSYNTLMKNGWTFFVYSLRLEGTRKENPTQTTTTAQQLADASRTEYWHHH